MSESSHVWAPLRDQFKARYRNGDINRVENSLRSGEPDVFMAFSPSAYAKVELKYLKHWPKAATDIGLRKEQKLFIREWIRKRLPIYVLLRCADTFYLFNGKFTLTDDHPGVVWCAMAIAIVSAGESFDPIFDVMEHPDAYKQDA